MSNLSDRVSYLRGLAEGMKVNEESNEGKLIKHLIELMGDVIEELDDLTDTVEELNEYVESIDEDLAALEEDDDDEGDDDDDDEYFSASDYDFDELDFEEDDDDDKEFERLLKARNGESDDDESVFTVSVCPECEGLFRVGLSADMDSMFTCPRCSRVVPFKPMLDGNEMPVAQKVDEPDEDE